MPDLNQSERRILSGCLADAFTTRVLPMSAIGALFLGTLGGGWRRMMLAAGAGGALGAASYVRVCRDRFVREAPLDGVANQIRSTHPLMREEVVALEDMVPTLHQENHSEEVPMTYDRLRETHRRKELAKFQRTHGFRSGGMARQTSSCEVEEGDRRRKFNQYGDVIHEEEFIS